MDLLVHLWLCTLLLQTLPARAAAPQPSPHFTQTLSNNSIMDGVVTAVAQDAQGYIWAGGATGIARYDAYHFVRFPLRARAGDPEVISAVTTILPGRDGRLWLGMVSVGLVALDPRTGLAAFFRHDAANPQSLSKGMVRAIVSDGADGLWVGTSNGLDHFLPGKGKFEHLHAGTGELPDDDIQCLLLDSRGALWAGGAKGLVRKQRDGSRFERVLRDAQDEARLARQVVLMLREDRAGRLWVGTQSGSLLIVEPGSGRAEWLVDGDAEHAGVVNSMAETDGTVWIGRSNGIEIRAADSGALLQRVRHMRERVGSLAASDVRGIVRDRSGVLFVGLYGGGVQRHVPPLPGIAVHAPAPDDPLADISIRSIVEMRNGQIWLGRAGRGVAVLDPALRVTGEIALPGQRQGGAASAVPVGALVQGADGHAWVGTDDGLYEFGADGGFIRRYDTAGSKIRKMLADRDGVIWIGTRDGLLRRPVGADALMPVPLAQGGSLRGNVDALAQDPAGRIWIGDVAGIYWIDAARGVAQPLEAKPVAAQGRYAVKGMLADKDGLWVDTDDGRYRVDQFDGRSARYTQVIDSKGEGGHAIGANLLRDRAGRIWTHRGIHNPALRRYDEFSSADGVDFGTGWFRSYAQLRDGRMLFGGAAGLLVVEPDKYRAWSYRPPVVLTSLEAGGKPVAIPVAGALRIAPPQRSFRAEFSALDYSFPERNRYRYRLQGYDPGWRETSASLRVASYDNLPPGDYSLQVQGSNRNGEWSDVQAALSLTVLPAWWETWWARLGMLLLAGVAMLAVVQWRTMTLRRREEELELRVLERTAQLQEVSAALEIKSHALEMASLTDPLTGLHNRRFLSEHIDADIALSLRQYEDSLRRAEAPPVDADLIFFLIDIDHFKQVNDQYGHSAGDAVLSQMRGRLLAIFRDSDFVIRWGGEEFLVVARGTRRARAAELAERARAVVADQPFLLPDGGVLPKTCSIGYACFPLAQHFPQEPGWQAVVELADAALYIVKNSGRNGWHGISAVHVDDEAGLRALLLQPFALWAGMDCTVIDGSQSQAGGPVIAAADAMDAAVIGGIG